jgi:hypothetical protein
LWECRLSCSPNFGLWATQVGNERSWTVDPCWILFSSTPAVYPEVASAFERQWRAELLEYTWSEWWECRLSCSPNFGLWATQVGNERSWTVDPCWILFSSTPAVYPEVASAFERQWRAELLEYTWSERWECRLSCSTNFGLRATQVGNERSWTVDPCWIFFSSTSAVYPEVASAFERQWRAELLEYTWSEWWECRLCSPNFGLRATQVGNERSWTVDPCWILSSSTSAVYPEVASAFERQWRAELLEYTWSERWECRLCSPNFGLRATQVENVRSWTVDFCCILSSSTPAACPEVASAFERQWRAELLEQPWSEW